MPILSDAGRVVRIRILRVPQPDLQLPDFVAHAFIGLEVNAWFHTGLLPDECPGGAYFVLHSELVRAMSKKDDRASRTLAAVFYGGENLGTGMMACWPNACEEIGEAV